MASYCGQTSHFPLSVKFPWLMFIAKLTVSRCFAIHDRCSMWSASYPFLYKPGFLLRPSTPLNNPPTLLPLSTALFHVHLFLVRLSSSLFSHSQLLSQSFSLSRLPQTTATTTRARARLRLWVKALPAGPLVLSRLANSVSSSVGLTRALLSCFPHRNPKTPLVH